MTYCAGWRYANSVYLIADSASKQRLGDMVGTTYVLRDKDVSNMRMGAA